MPIRANVQKVDSNGAVLRSFTAGENERGKGKGDMRVAGKESVSRGTDVNVPNRATIQ